MNIRLIAIEAGDALKYDVSVKDIDRKGSAIFPFRCDNFPHDSITSARAQRIYDWLMSLGRQICSEHERITLLSKFLFSLAPSDEKKSRMAAILQNGGVKGLSPEAETLQRFDARGYHSSIIQHSRKLYGQTLFFHAVFEAAKAYNKAVRDKSQSLKDGAPLMLEVWSSGSGNLKITAGITETDRNVQDGIKFLSAGLMQAIRNPTSHEPALDWPISEQDAADILSFISFLFRQLDRSVKYP